MLNKLKPIKTGTATLSSSEILCPTRAYNDTLLNRCSVLTQIALFRNCPSHRPPHCSKIMYLSPTRLVKFGRTVHLSEASALRLVAASTSIPVPKVYCAFRDEKSGKSYIVMERIDGEMLEKRWGQMTKKERERILGQLKGMWEELRGIVNPKPGSVCAADGGTLHDYRIYGGAGAKGMGPFKTEREFNLFLRGGIESMENKKVQNAEGERKKWNIEKLIKMHREEEERHLNTVFTHGDVSLYNILVKGGKVVALIDFEMSGFYPEYWEYTTAMDSNYIRGWVEEIDKFLKPYPREMADLWRMYFCNNP